MLQEKQINPKWNLKSKDISIVIRYTIFLLIYIKSFEPEFVIRDNIEFVLDDDVIFEHEEHIMDNIDLIETYVDLYFKHIDAIKTSVNQYLKNNIHSNLGIVGILLNLIILEIIMNAQDESLIICDYFLICNIFNIPNKYIKFINNIVKNIGYIDL
jgi:transcription termination factor NusB